MQLTPCNSISMIVDHGLSFDIQTGIQQHGTSGTSVPQLQQFSKLGVI